MNNSSPERNKATVLEGFETLFNKRDYAAAQRFWSPSYIQHSAHIAPGREGLFDLVRSLPGTLHYENRLIASQISAGRAGNHARIVACYGLAFPNSSPRCNARK